MPHRRQPTQPNPAASVLPPPAQVPAYEVKWAGARRHSACVVIPVINEGARLHSLLGKMQALHIDTLADVVVVDGGSTDGSLAPAVATPLGVHTLLVKTGPGKLSAQLRVAYAHVLEAGYSEIITIDGNDKDDPAPIPAFIEAVRNGTDFVQASRYIPGGYAERTPWLRNVAIRLVHAPLLSLASGFWWTDTTQGFRGYSRRLLLDARVSIFRDIFNRYELLAYLNYRAPRLGFVCRELPTSRIYPPGEVPTKISALRGNADVLKTLFKACLGHFNPA